MTTTDLVGAKKTLDSGMRRVILFNTPMGVPWPGTCLDGWTKMDMDEAYEAEVMERIRTMQSDPEVGEKVRKLITAHNQFLALKRYVMHYASRDRGVEEGYCYLYHYVGRE